QVDPAGRQVFFQAGHLSEAERADPAERAFRIAVGGAAPAGAGGCVKTALVARQHRQPHPRFDLLLRPVRAPTQLCQAIPTPVRPVAVKLGKGDHAGIELTVVIDQAVDFVDERSPGGQAEPAGNVPLLATGVTHDIALGPGPYHQPATVDVHRVDLLDGMGPVADAGEFSVGLITVDVAVRCYIEDAVAGHQIFEVSPVRF